MATWNTTRTFGGALPWLLVLAISGGCADAPRKVDEGWGEDAPEQRNQVDRGAEERAAVPAERGEVPGGQAKPAPRNQEDASASAPPEMDAGGAGETEDVRPDDQGGESIDASQSTREDVNASDAAGEDPGDAAVEDPGDPTQDNRGDAASAAPDAALPAADAAEPADPCDPNPCAHGSCAGDAGAYTCTCADGYLGQQCEQRVCGDVAIRSRADVEDNRDCAEIRGSLTISSLGLTSITADDFPFLKRIKGDLVISGQHATSEQPHLDTITLRNLRAVDGALVVVGVALAGVGGSGPLNELHLPALERVGEHGGVGLALFQANLRVLDLPALTLIEGSAMLESLLELCSVRLDALERIGGSVALLAIPRLQPAELESLRAAAAGAVNEQQLGCCAASEDEQVACEGFTESARSLSCTGCGGTVVKTAG